MNKFIEIYDHVLNKKCLCSLSDDRNFIDIFHCTFFKSIPDVIEEIELLCISLIRLIAETYAEEELQNSSVCVLIHKFIDKFAEDEFWCNFINYCKAVEEKYLQFVSIKAMTALICIFPPSLSDLRIQQLLDNVNSSEVEDSFILELLSNLLYYITKHDHKDDSNSECRNKSPCSKSSKQEIFSCVYNKLSQNWDVLRNLFLKAENENLNSFLAIWMCLIEKQLNEDLSLAFANQDLALEFLSLAPKLSPVSLQLYLNIISQIFCSSYKTISWKYLGNKKVEETVLSAVNNGFLEALPSYNLMPVFCKATKRHSSPSSQNISGLDTISKKAIFVILNLLVDFQDMSMLSKVLERLFSFVALNTNIDSCESRCLWISDVFIDEDDILFGAMLTFIRIYLIMKELRSEFPDLSPEWLNRKYNPHEVFIKFLKQTGFDHNELLSFLTSDETCCLLYLLKYVKLILSEMDTFVEAHQVIVEETVPTHSSKYTNLMASENSESSCDKKLVLYSSSSSSEDECELTTEIFKIDKRNHLESLAKSTLLVLVNLKKAIQKLIDVNEFPYNISPLMFLLFECEKLVTTLR